MVLYGPDGDAEFARCGANTLISFWFRILCYNALQLFSLTVNKF